MLNRKEKHYFPPNHQALIFGFLHTIIINLFKTQLYSETINFPLLLIENKKQKTNDETRLRVSARKIN